MYILRKQLCKNLPLLLHFSPNLLFLSDFRMISKSLVSNTVVKPKVTLPDKVQNSIKRKELSDKSFCPDICARKLKTLVEETVLTAFPICIRLQNWGTGASKKEHPTGK